MRVTKLSTLLEGLVSIPPEYDCDIFGVAIDSRKVESKFLFIAYPGFKNDGREYISSAILNGAVVVFCEDEKISITTQEVAEQQRRVLIITYPEVRKSVGTIAAKFYGDPTREMFVVGVTGTNGKTSCTQFIAKTLQDLHYPCGVLGTLGMGFPEKLTPVDNTTSDPVTLQSRLAELKDQSAQAVAMEVSSHGLEQNRLQGVHFNVAVFTNLTRDHLDYHGTMENYGAAKKKLFSMPGLEYAVINIDDEFGRRLLQGLPKALKLYAYSVQETECPAGVGLIKAYDIKLEAQGIRAKVTSPWGDGVIESTLLGKFNLSNLLAVMTTLGIMQIPLPEILKALALLRPFGGRMQSFGGGKLPLVVVDYAHTPDALEKALLALREHCLGKLWCVFGCGGERDPGKRPMMGQIAERLSDNIIITNDNPRSENPDRIISDIVAGLTCPWAAEIEADRRIAIAHAINSSKQGDVILVAGKGHENYQIIGMEKIPYSDIDVVEKLLLELKESGF